MNYWDITFTTARRLIVCHKGKNNTSLRAEATSIFLICADNKIIGFRFTEAEAWDYAHSHSCKYPSCDFRVKEVSYYNDGQERE